MKNVFRSGKLERLNNELVDMIKEDKVNNFNIFAFSDKGSKLSVTMEPDTRYNEQYHGLNPKFDETEMHSFLSNLESNTTKGFWDSVKKVQLDKKPMNIILPDSAYHNEDGYLYKLARNNELKKDLELSLLGRSILQMTSHYGYVFKTNKQDTYDKLKKELNKIFDEDCYNKDKQTLNKKENFFYWKCNDKKNELNILGIWPKNAIKKLCNKFTIFSGKTGLVFRRADNRSTSSNDLLYELLTFKGKWKNYYKLVSSDIYYSGVMPCVRDIIYKESSASSGKVKYLVFKVIRTTFATLDTMDNPLIINHDFFTNEDGQLASHKRILLEFDTFEDRMQRKHLYCSSIKEQRDQKEYERDVLDNLKRYIHRSLNTHTIAVSANLITKDGYLITGKRGELNIDASEYYCSANGQSEFRDENVDFYRKSVFEDMPTMDYKSKYRIDLSQEIQRECVAELGISSFNLNWECYGVSYLSINNNMNGLDLEENRESSERVKHRRMHFNVLMENYILQDFKDVVKSQKHATESFENKQIRGIKVKVFRNRRSLIFGIFKTTYNWLERNKSSLLLSILFILTILGKERLSNFHWTDHIEIILIIAYVIISVISWIAEIKLRKLMSSVNYYLPKQEKSGFSGVINKLLKERKFKGSRPHAIFRAMYLLYFLEFSEED